MQSQIDQLKGGEIATISSQIKAIDASINDLKKVDETIEGLIAELQKDGENYAAQIAELIKMDSKLDEKIAELQQYTDGELAKQKDWVNATFATLEQLEALSETVAGLGVKIGEITESLKSAKKEITEKYEKAISEAVSSLEESMKQWVNEQLADYYTIAQIDAVLKALEEKYDKADEDLKKELEAQKTALEDSKKEITEAYKKAIEEAISAHDGKINEKIAKDIATAKKELQDQIDTINAEITEIKTRLDALEKELEAIAKRVQSIVVLAVNPVVLTTGAQATIEFRVNPSTAVFDYSEENCQIVLDKVGTVQTKASYVTKPSNYKLVKIEPAVDEETQEVKAGQYRATIEDIGKSAEYDEMVALVLNTKDEKGNDVQISSSVFEVIGKNFDNLMKTGLPIVVVNTPNSEPILSKEEWIAGASVSIINSDMTFDYKGTTNIKGRGNATWRNYPKKPYKLKLSDKHPVFGNPKSKKWQLLAEYCDKSFLRTAMMLELSKIANIRHTVSYDFVELYLNGEYNGLYILTEQVEKDKNRIDVKDDGFIIEDDNYATQEPVWFTTTTTNRNYSFKYPDPDDAIVAGDDNYNYIKDFMNDMESALYSDNYQDAINGYRSYIDCESFAKWYIVMELMGNWDPNWYYVLDSRGSKLEMIPCWDAEWSLGLAEVGSNGWSQERGKPMAFNRRVNNKRYFSQLLSDPYFKSVVKAEWEEIEVRIPQAVQNVQNVRNNISNAANHNFTKWPTLGTYPGVSLYTFDTWDEEADFIFTYFQQRLEWFDSYIDSL